MYGNHIGDHGLMNICICDYIWSFHFAWVYYVIYLRDIRLCVLEELPKDKWFCYSYCNQIYVVVQNSVPTRGNITPAP